MMDRIQAFFEIKIFGVSEWWAEKLNIKTSQVRLFFIYLSFLTFGSPVIVYLVMAFILKNKEWFKFRRSTIWEL